MSNVFVARLVISLIFLPAVGILSVATYNYFGMVAGTYIALYLWWVVMFVAFWGIAVYKADALVEGLS